MRVAVHRGLFRPVTFTTTDDGECVCAACGSVVRDQAAHRGFHEAVQYVARDADDAQATAAQACGMARRGGF